MKKVIALLLSAALLLSLAACTGAPAADDSNKLKIISTTFPGYDFAKQICGDLAEVSILVPPGAESHSYEPTPKDIIDIENCDLFIYVGGMSEAWVEDILNTMETEVPSIKMMNAVTLYEEEIVPGMTPEDEHEHGDEDNHDKETGSDAEAEYDEHIWTSPANARKLVVQIYNKLIRLFPEYRDRFKENYKPYADAIHKLNSEFFEFFRSVDNKLLVFGDRFPLRYFVEEYDIEYYAAFPGCSSETEPSAAKLAELINLVKEKNVSTVFYIEFSNHKVADSIAEATNTKTALFHTCHNVSNEDIKNGATYVSLMEQNLETLKEAMK